MNIKKFLVSATAGAVILASTALPAFAAPGGKDSPANDNPQNLYLYQKDANAAFGIVWNGAWGKYNYKLSGTGAETTVSGVFNGHGLVAGEDYSLIYYPEVATNPWPATGWGVVVIGSGTANAGGNVHIAGTGVIGDPDTQPTEGDYIGQTGDKIWLVLSDDLTDSNITGWNPAGYLFENNLINKP